MARFEGERQGEPYFYHPGLLFDLDLNPAEEFSFTCEYPDVVDKKVERLEMGRSGLEILGTQYGD